MDNIIISGLCQLITNEIVDSDIVESRLVAKPESVRKFNVLEKINLSVFSSINSDPIDTRKVLCSKGLRIPTVPEIIFFSQQSKEFSEFLDGKWFRADLVNSKTKKSIDKRNWWILRFCIDDSGKLNYQVEEDRLGIILKKVVGIETPHLTGLGLINLVRG